MQSLTVFHHDCFQEAFSGLLGDANELTQEMASRGISVVYSLSDDAARKQLLDGLVSTLQGVQLSIREMTV